MKNHKTCNNKGFTLIELLVVISIISLLSTVVLSSLSVAKSKARDAQRMSDLHQIQNAIELYRVDTGTIPATERFFAEIHHPSYPGIVNVLAPQYIPQVPEDPSSPGTPPNGAANGWWYYYGRSYHVKGADSLPVLEGTDFVQVSDNEYVICSKMENLTGTVSVGSWGVFNYCING